MVAVFRFLALGLALASNAPAPADPVVTGLGLLSAGRAAEADRLLARAVASRPEDGPAWNALGLARHSLELWPSAATAFARAATLMPDDPRVRANLGAALLEAGDLARAREELLTATRLDAAYAKPHLLLGRVAAATGDAVAAEAAFREAVRLGPEEPAASYHLGLLLLQLRRHDEAIASLMACLRLSPDMPSAHLNLGLALRRSGREADAARHLDRFRDLSEAIARDAHEQARLSSALVEARLALENARPDAALRHAYEARSLAPHAPAPHALAAEALMRLGRPEEAAAERQRAQQLAAASAPSR